MERFRVSNPGPSATALKLNPRSQRIRFDRSERPQQELAETIVSLCGEVLGHIDPQSIRLRAAIVGNLRLWTAAHDGKIIGFKAGYEREPGSFLSWLGGVSTPFRRLGIASRLTEIQHRDLALEGLLHVETRTRADNSRMIILNLKHGFEIIGTEVDALSRLLVLQRKALGGPFQAEAGEARRH